MVIYDGLASRCRSAVSRFVYPSAALLPCWALAIVLVFLVGMAPPNAVGQPDIQRAGATEILEAVAKNEAQVTVVNFWATWCVPCIEEFPALMRLDDRYPDANVDVVFVSVDFTDARDDARSFLAEQGLTERSYMKTGMSTSFVNAFSDDWSGAVPATFLYDAKGALLEFWEGKASYEEMNARVKSYLGES